METKYVIYRILIIKQDGSRETRKVDIHTDQLEAYRESFKKIHKTERICFSYHEKEDYHYDTI